MIKKIFSALVVVLFATSMMAQTGLTCEDAIPVDKSYVGHVDGPCELWYTAWTYDLPMHVYFSPDSTNQIDYGPDVQIDFTCEEGVYTDHKLDSVINILKVLGLSLPVEMMCDRVVRDGKWEWDLAIDEKYRDQLTEYGLTHNIQAFVKVTFYEGGSIRLTPDTAFQSCIEHGHYAQLGDTIDIAANDTEKMIVLPFSEWQKDSIRFVWTGDKPARIWVAEDECRFTPVDGSVYVKAKYDVDSNTPKKLYPSDMKNAIDNWIGAGIFYAKVISEGAGQLIVERIPLGAIQGDAVLLKRGESVQLSAHDDRVFCFPKTWTSTEFLANTQNSLDMYVSNTPDFAPTPDDVNVIAKYAFRKEGNKRQLQLSTGDISFLGNKASDDYLYVRFACDKATTLDVAAWSNSSCIEKTILISSGQTISVPASSKSVYRMLYKDWANYDFTIQWGGRSTLSAAVASYCDFASTDPEVLRRITVKSRNSADVAANMLDSWGTSVDSDGFLYFRLTSERQGNITFTSAKPEEEDPIAPLDPVYTTISETLCYGESYEWNGQVYAKSGEYSQTFTAANGADSIVTLNLTILPAVPVTKETATVCHGESFEWQGTTYSESGEYSVTLKNVNGCDSVVTLNLTILPAVAPTSEEVTVAYGETYEWHGVVYAESGSYTITLQDENGCDYRATLHLTVLPNPEKTDLQPTDMMPLDLQDAFKVITMEQSLWSAQDVKLHWDGVSPLHVFVAKQKVYALTPYNRHVLHYEMIPAGAEWTLSKDMMSAWESYIVEGVLYVRFLTELPGTLTTTVAE